ncbi:MAG TPA: YezD family protein [Polyangiaceae bacterium]
MGAPISRARLEAALHPDALDPTEIADAVTAAARGLRYGSIEVVVHDARVVQIIRTEKRRIVK